MPKTIAIDFDGVVHAYSQGWQDGEIYDDPAVGLVMALCKLRPNYRLVIFTARHDLGAVATWLREHHLDHYFSDVTNRKPAAAVYLDDRAIRFISWDQALKDIKEVI